MAPFTAWLQTAVVVALLFGLSPPDPNLTGEPSPLPNDWTLLAAAQGQSDDQAQVQSEESADESAKMGNDSGTKAGDEAATPDNDTNKIDQPDRQNPTSN